MTLTKTLTNLIGQTARRHDTWQVFRDFVAMAACSISNAVDLRSRETREAEYLAIVQRYEREEIDRFPQMLAALTDALEDDMADILGRLFSELDLGNKWAGQFFSPDSLCRMMAAMTFDSSARELIETRGFIRASEPCVGAGAMVIALARELRRQGINYQRHLHVTAADIDIRAVHMAYIQLSLLHVPAVIVHGNSLSLEEYSHWYTPAHIWGGWTGRLRGAGSGETVIHAAPPLAPAQPEPEPDSGPAPRQLSLF